jgi:hypothetical protein
MSLQYKFFSIPIPGEGSGGVVHKATTSDVFMRGAASATAVRAALVL